MSKLFFGQFIHTKSITNFEILLNYGLEVVDGIIKNFKPKSEFDLKNYKNYEILEMTKTQFMIPGFIDTHTHAAQYFNNGLGTDLPLLDWLQKYTFPLESKFKENSFAIQMYDKCVSRHLNNGTTTSCYYGTIHLEGCLSLFNAVQEKGQRAFVGKVCMDQNSPDFYIETTKESLENTEKFIQIVQEKSNGLAIPIITPRFAPTCSTELMKGLSGLVKKYNVPIQTHISENKAEIQWVKELFPEQKYYTDVYDACGLAENALLGHGIYLSNDELATMKKKSASVCHCPLSNFVLGSGALDIRRLLKEEIKVGLGTDCSGGYAPSILNAIRNAIISSHTRNFMNRDEKQIEEEISKILDSKSLFKHDETTPLSYKESFYLGTLGGADVVGLKDKIGNFEVNKELDALLIDVDVKNGPFDSFYDMEDDKENLDLDWFEKSFQRFIFLGDDRNIVKVYVRGKTVKEL